MTAPIGFSTRCLDNRKFYLRDKLQLFAKAGATAVEMYFTDPQDFLGLNQYVLDLQPFGYVAIHAPSKDVFYTKGDHDTQCILDKLKDITTLRWDVKLDIDAIAIHPDIVKSMDLLVQSKLPFALTNLANGTATGPPYFSHAAYKYKLPFVLDVKQAFQRDATGKHTIAVAHNMCDGIQYIRASGSNKSQDVALLSQSTNREIVVDTLQRLPNKPLILEGTAEGNIEELLTQELDLMHKARRKLKQ